jgi:hypothetical protein
MWFKLRLFIFLFFAASTLQAQNGDRLQISLLTCEPGQDLNELFGHSALRIIDSNSVNDYVYNFGTFDFEDKNFYLKFIRGKLLYFVDVANYTDFVGYYFASNRQITEQVLQLTAQEKVDIYRAIINNCKDENKFYKYDFFFDNCTTRLKDLIEKYTKSNSSNTATMPLNFSFRNAIHQYLDGGQQAWSKLGIDILLGAKTDEVMTASQQQFLPNNLMFALDKTTNPKLVFSKQNIFQLQANKKEKTLATPFFVLLIISIFFAATLLLANNKIKLIADKFLFVAIGFLGLLLLFMWFGTDHITTKNNYNLLWANPLLLIFACSFSKTKKASKLIAALALLPVLICLLSWYFLPQQLNAALLPIVVLLTWRLCFTIFSK